VADPKKESVVERQARFNRSTRSHWQHFAPHRNRVMDLVFAGRETQLGGRFVALGAGNCNDLDLRRLIDGFHEVHLVEIDPAALKNAARRQDVGAEPQLKLHAPVDLTGIAEIVSGWKGRVPSPADVRHAIEVSQAAPLPTLDGKPFDVVLSSCVLSQLVGYATDSLGGDRHPLFADFVRAIRARHLRLMLELCKAGATALLVCDLVSSDSASELPRLEEHALPGFIRKLAGRGNFFSGLFPDAMIEVCRTDSAIAPHVRDVRLLPPWVWRLGPERFFLVYALRTVRAGAESRLIC
jgi:hypothetical protein